MTSLYRIIYFVVVRLLLPWLHPINEKVSRGYLLRKYNGAHAPWLEAPAQQRPLWIHCASGEFEYALPLIREIKKNNPQQKVMVTYFTPSYVKKIKAEPLVDYVFPSPWDEPRTMQEFVNYHKPQALLFARTDVWFEMTRQCHLAGIPVIVFSMTFHKKINIMLRRFLKWRWQYVDKFYVVSKEDQLSLCQLLPRAQVEVSGDSRYDQCLYRLSQKKPLPFQIENSPKKLIVAGSTWNEDEKVLLPIIQKTLNQWRWILVPHESTKDHLYELTQHLQSLQIPFVRSSFIQSWRGEEVLLVDQVGFLAELYPFADASFIGGSFRKQVHSVMESLASGCLTYVGPSYKNNREAIEFSASSDTGLAPVQVVHTRDELLDKINSQLSHWNQKERNKLQLMVASKSGASTRLAQKIQLAKI
jgi:3-deoxy-D-manno-octulosonic-acid transferase